ncbi:anthranilate synthase component I family protein [Spirosoma rhododendri]|uniref:Anthranilate synthase component I family protein n=1 Tax=Spirosoma rhododendri TaxID=2728024 RepID=A0A7L5DGS2_9BACT|nr:anthranilate synthase component I family protein [Spirosoma rhododendri]QJD77409.1 anthranilate synthase component I family protein [Spirosoma rhododendri]
MDTNLEHKTSNVELVFWQRALAWALAQPQNDGVVALLNNSNIEYPNDPFPNRLFVGAKRVVGVSDASDGPDAFELLRLAQAERPSHWVGYLGYDLKNQLERLNSRHPNRIGFADAFFAEPRWIIDYHDGAPTLAGEGDTDALLTDLLAFPMPAFLPVDPQQVQCRVTSDAYMTTVRQIQQFIRAGEVYELNYCVEFFAEQARLDPMATYWALNERSPMPFSAFLKLDDHYMMGASPERFLKKTGATLTSQPIKGTIRRGKTADEDAQLRVRLLNSEKERAENLMIVDLVRNDLARSAQTGTVRVDELFGIYSFRQVFQMISTVSATLHPDSSWTDAIRNAFPMGSMTGAPKIRSMELIDELESSRRGLYSGAFGYVTSDNNFDFNVVIRSLLYDARQQYASFSVGSAITYDADPAQEWDECLLKARAIRDLLEGC